MYRHKFRQIKNKKKLRKRLYNAMNEIWTVSCDTHHYPDSHSPFTIEELDDLHAILQKRLGETYDL